jgi:hypothetical protein
MNGANEQWWVMVLLIIITIVFWGTVGWMILLGIRWLRGSVGAARQTELNELRLSAAPGPGLVKVVFHTYHGFLVFVEQTEHRFWATPDDARLALWRLYQSNLTWGMFAYGMLLIPLLSYGNYVVQKRAISKQQALFSA